MSGRIEPLEVVVEVCATTRETDYSFINKVDTEKKFLLLESD